MDPTPLLASSMDLAPLVAFTTPGFAEVVFLLLLALLIFGPEKLPNMARTAGRTLSRFKAEATSTLDELKDSVDVDELRQTANVDELREVADELRTTSAELERSTGTSWSGTSRSLRGPAGGHGPAAVGAEGAEAEERDEPAPFDPDAT